MDTLISKPHGRIGEQIAKELGVGNSAMPYTDFFCDNLTDASVRFVRVPILGTRTNLPFELLEIVVFFRASYIFPIM